ncbi:MAG: radical SAM protein [Deltaproteobacteria bacterium]|nr:radical SAM protein [Deltaproteobacteria bacterium]
MKVVFVYPRFKKYLSDFTREEQEILVPIVGGFTTPPSLGIPLLAAMTNREHQVEVIDDNRGDKVDFDMDADLVAINCFTPQATRAMELADGFGKAGKKVIMGGIFPSFMPDQVLEHADSVNIGEGEPTWETILEDAGRGELKRVYKGGNRFDLAKLPVPRRDVLYGKAGYDWHAALVQTARGCNFNCAMCVLPAHFGYRVRTRPVHAIMEEIEKTPYDQIYLADDTIFIEKPGIEAWARDLLEKLAHLDKRLFVSGTLALNTKQDFFKLLARAGTKTFYCTLNVDPFSMRALQGNDRRAELKVKDLVSMVNDLGMEFFASFGMGRDWDDEGVADRILELCGKTGIKTAEFFLFTPFPGSPHYSRMESQGRLLHKVWEKYNGANVVFKPMKMKPGRLHELYSYVWRQMYKGAMEDQVLKKLGKQTGASPHPDAGKRSRS